MTDDLDNTLSHVGVKGMKWGVRKTPATLTINKSDHAMTKQVKRDFNTLDNKAFFRKYQASRRTYAYRVSKNPDPYKKVLEAYKKDPDRDRKIRRNTNLTMAAAFTGVAVATYLSDSGLLTRKASSIPSFSPNDQAGYRIYMAFSR